MEPVCGVVGDGGSSARCLHGGGVRPMGNSGEETSPVVVAAGSWVGEEQYIDAVHVAARTAAGEGLSAMRPSRRRREWCWVALDPPRGAGTRPAGCSSGRRECFAAREASLGLLGVAAQRGHVEQRDEAVKSRGRDGERETEEKDFVSPSSGVGDKAGGGRSGKGNAVGFGLAATAVMG
jgi:hypothetical protein